MSDGLFSIDVPCWEERSRDEIFSLLRSVPFWKDTTWASKALVLLALSFLCTKWNLTSSSIHFLFAATCAVFPSMDSVFNRGLKILFFLEGCSFWEETVSWFNYFGCLEALTSINYYECGLGMDKQFPPSSLKEKILAPSGMMRLRLDTCSIIYWVRNMGVPGFGFYIFSNVYVFLFSVRDYSQTTPSIASKLIMPIRLSILSMKYLG